MRERGLVIDLTYTLIKPDDITKLFRLPYRMLGRTPNLREFLIGLARLPSVSWLECIAEEGLKYNPFCGTPSPLVSKSVLARANEDYVIMVASREHRKRVEYGLNATHYAEHIDAFVCREDVGFGVRRKEHIRECIKRLYEEFGINSQNCIVASDSPSDLEVGRVLGARTCWVRTGYHNQFGKFKPDGVFDSLEAALLAYIGEVEQRYPQILSVAS